MSPEDFKKCREAWLKTLARFGVKRNLMVTEELEIARAVKKHGAEAVELALYGAGFEPKSDKFDPANFVKIGRVLRPDAKGEERIDRFVNLGAQQRAKEEARALADEEMRQRVARLNAQTPVEAKYEEGFKQDPEKVKAILGRFLKGMPR